jgi:hypothetical protein
MGTEEDKFYKSECNHIFHVCCMQKMISFRCPLCRARFKNLPKYIGSKIRDQATQYREEKTENEGLDLFEEVLTFVKPPLDVQIRLVFRYLSSIGITSKMIPENIVVAYEYDQGNPFAFFSLLVFLVLDFRRKNIHYQRPYSKKYLVELHIHSKIPEGKTVEENQKHYPGIVKIKLYHQ